MANPGEAGREGRMHGNGHAQALSWADMCGDSRAEGSLKTESKTSERKLQRKRRQRDERRDLLRAIDELLPHEDKKSNPVKTSGARACGLAGRSQHNVLSDLKQHILRRLSAESSNSHVLYAEPALRPDDLLCMMRSGFLSSRSMFVAEVQLPNWSIRALSPGAHVDVAT